MFLKSGTSHGYFPVDDNVFTVGFYPVASGPVFAVGFFLGRKRSSGYFVRQRIGTMLFPRMQRRRSVRKLKNSRSDSDQFFCSPAFTRQFPFAVESRQGRGQVFIISLSRYN